MRTLQPLDIQLFAIMSGDVNRRTSIRSTPRAACSVSDLRHVGRRLISTVLGTRFRSGTIYIDQTLHFSRPVAWATSSP
jgi:hypothetical protein